MKNIAITVLLLFAGNASIWAQLHLSTNSKLTLQGGVELALHEINFDNNGNFNAGDGTMKFKSGGPGADLEIKGDSTSVFHHLTLEVGERKLRLEKEAEANGDITFMTGQFDLNGHDLELGPDGMIMGEGPNGCFVGSGGGFVFKPVTLNAPMAEDPGNLGAKITSDENLGETIIKRGHQEQLNGADLSILRYYEITPTNNAGLDATLRFHYLDEELNGVPEADLSLFRDAGAGWVNRGYHTHNTTENYLELTGIDAFSSWTAFAGANPLPVELLFFHAEKNADESAALLTWATASELENQGFEIQRSMAGQVWEAIGFSEGHGTSNQEHEYRFIDAKPLSGLNYYRLRQIDFSEKTTYSPVRLLDFGNAVGMTVGHVFPNPTTAQQGGVALPVTLGRSAEVQVRLVDAFGRILQSWYFELAEGAHLLDLKMEGMPSGIQHLQVVVDGSVFLQKIMVE